jgi:hypothetical protein
VRRGVDVDPVDVRPGELVRPHLDRGPAAGVPATHDPCVPRVPGDAHADLEETDGFVPLGPQVRLVDVREVAGAPRVRSGLSVLLSEP